jgi:hypothetical protein
MYWPAMVLMPPWGKSGGSVTVISIVWLAGRVLSVLS